MATRQYIGARYVPKFADPIAWDNANAYEALTIVTYNGTTYTSKKAVPAGTAITNSEYWVATGNYNAQVEEYREEVAALNDRTYGNVKPLNMKKVIMIGDSYAAQTTNWCDALATRLGLSASEYYKIAGSSMGFARAVNGKVFLTLLQEWVAAHTATEIGDISHIIVCAGANDNTGIVTESDVLAAITTFCNYVKNNFEDATLFIGGIGRNADYRYSAVVQAANETYAKGARANSVHYLTGVDWILHDSRLVDSTDKVHPNSDGVAALASGIYEALMYGCVHVTSGLVQSAKIGLGDDGRLYYDFTDGNIELKLAHALNISVSPSASISSYTPYTLGSGIVIPWTCGTQYNTPSTRCSILFAIDGGTYEARYGVLYIHDGELIMEYEPDGLATPETIANVRAIAIPPCTLVGHGCMS